MLARSAFEFERARALRAAALCIEGDMKLQPVEIPARPRDLRVEALAVTDPRFTADTNSGVIELFDVIDDQTPARISAALRAIGNRPALVAINSPGGNVYAGLTAFNLLRGHAPGVTTR